MKRKILKMTVLVFSLVILLMLLTACGNEKGVSKALLGEDVERIASEIDLENVFSSEFVYESPYEHGKNGLVKRQTNVDEKEDILYYDFIVQNEYFEVVYHKKLIYGLYDSGWVLDAVSDEGRSVIPRRAAEADLIFADWNKDKEYINGTNYPTSFSMDRFIRNGRDIRLKTEIETCNLSEDNLQTRLYMTAECSLSKMSGYIPLTFDDTDGWVSPDNGDLKYMITDLECDYSRANGTFKSNNNIYAVSTWTLKIREEDGKVDCNLLTEYSDGRIVPHTDSLGFNPFLGECGGVLLYNEKNDVWEETTVVYGSGNNYQFVTIVYERIE